MQTGSFTETRPPPEIHCEIITVDFANDGCRQCGIDHRANDIVFSGFDDQIQRIVATPFRVNVTGGSPCIHFEIIILARYNEFVIVPT